MSTPDRLSEARNQEQIKVELAPAKTPTPGAPRHVPLDGVTVSSCTFTESASSLAPRPPLFWVLICECGCQDGAVFLAAGNGRVYTRLPADRPCKHNIWPFPGSRLGMYVEGRPKGPAYTGPITPSMWAIINKWWKP